MAARFPRCRKSGNCLTRHLEAGIFQGNVGDTRPLEVDYTKIRSDLDVYGEAGITNPTVPTVHPLAPDIPQFNVADPRILEWIELNSHECFPSSTLISMWPVGAGLGSDTDANAGYDERHLLAGVWQKPIEEIVPGDVVVSFDEDGNLVPGCVERLFRNVTQEFVRLSFDNSYDDLIATPGHRFLTETGDFMEIGHMLRLGGGNVRLVDSV